MDISFTTTRVLVFFMFPNAMYANGVLCQMGCMRVRSGPDAMYAKRSPSQCVVSVKYSVFVSLFSSLFSSPFPSPFSNGYFSFSLLYTFPFLSLFPFTLPVPFPIFLIPFFVVLPFPSPFLVSILFPLPSPTSSSKWKGMSQVCCRYCCSSCNFCRSLSKGAVIRRSTRAEVMSYVTAQQIA